MLFNSLNKSNGFGEILVGMLFFILGFIMIFFRKKLMIWSEKSNLKIASKKYHDANMFQLIFGGFVLMLLGLFTIGYILFA